MAGSNSIIFYRTIDVGAAGSVTTDSIVYYSSGNISYLSDSVNVADVIGDTAGAGVTNKSWSANKLINELAKKEDKPDFVITFSDVNISAGTAIADKTPSEVITAYYEGKSIKAVYTGSTVPTEVVLRNVFESYVTFECLLFTMIYTFSGNAGENGWECYINRLLNGNLQEYWAQGSKIKYLGAPVDSTDATNKQYVDNAVGGLIDDTAGSGDTGKTWSADKIVGELGEKYEKPAGGIPATDLASAAQTSLEKADTAYQKPAGGIPATDLASGVIPDPTSIIDDTAGAGDTDRTFSADKLATDHSSLLSAINNKYSKPEGGIPRTDLADSYVESEEESLLRSEMPGTSTTVTTDSDGNPTSIVHTANSATVRTDTFVWGTETVTETRTLANGKYITITTNLETLAQTISAVQEVA